MDGGCKILLWLFAVLGSLVSFGERVTVLHTNDIHGKIGRKGALSYAQVAAYRDGLRAQGEAVVLVDAGDFSHGSPMGKIDKGESLTRIMNAAGYEAATIGNHEFDSGIPNLRHLAQDVATFPILACNFWATNRVAQCREPVLPSYSVVTAGTTRVAVVGLGTPETPTFSSPQSFADAEGPLFGFDGGADGTALYAALQQAVNEAAAKSDVVVVLGHLGVGASAAPWRSVDVIAHTTNFVAFIDGHSHTVVDTTVANAAGEPVRLVQTGAYLGALGELTIEDGRVVVSRRLDKLPCRGGECEEVGVAERALLARVDAWLGVKLAESTLTLCRDGGRPGVYGETNLGDFVTDATYWYVNAHEPGGCDVALCNYAGVRADAAPGPFTLRQANEIAPFGNRTCLLEVTGAQLRDALEWGARKAPGYVGGFLHCAGLKYAIETARPSTVAQVDARWTGGPMNGVYRVTDIEVYDRAAGAYRPLELTRTYRIAGGDFTLRYCGEGFEMLRGVKVVRENVQTDYLVLAEYVKAFATGLSGEPTLSSANAPLRRLPGYLLDYENREGSGRIVER